MREVNASEEQEQESSEWNVRELSGSEFDELSAASRYGGFQQTSEMAAAMRFEQRSRNDCAVFLNAKVFHFDPLAGTQTACGRGLLEVAVRVMCGKIVKRLRTQRNQRKCSHVILPLHAG